MKPYIAHEENGVIYVIEVDPTAETYPGAGTEQFDTLEEVQARWPDSVMQQDEPSLVVGLGAMGTTDGN